MATQELPSLALPCLALPCFALLCLALLCFALLCSVPLLRSACSALCPALLCSRSSGAPYRSGKAGRYNPQGGAHGCATFL
ncbi:hypothetical protein EIQ28_19445 [Xanthomonas campestris pv. plantaginis]